MKPFLMRWFVTTAAVFLTVKLMHGGISYDGWESLLAASLLLGIVNALVRPVLIILTAPVILVTFGLFLLVVNALMLSLVGKLVHGFEVRDFHAALVGSIIIGIISWILNGFVRDKDGKIHIVRRVDPMRNPMREVKPVDEGRVIDI